MSRLSLRGKFSVLLWPLLLGERIPRDDGEDVSSDWRGGWRSGRIPGQPAGPLQAGFLPPRLSEHHVRSPGWQHRMQVSKGELRSGQVRSGQVRSLCYIRRVWLRVGVLVLSSHALLYLYERLLWVTGGREKDLSRKFVSHFQARMRLMIHTVTGSVRQQIQKVRSQRFEV